MKFLKEFWRRFMSGGEPVQPLVEMINAAKVDPQIKKSLILILQMDTFQRRSAIGSLTTRLRMQQAPEGLIAGLILLEDDDLAATALALLED